MSNDKWRTPKDTFDYWNGKYKFAADVAATPSNALCDVFYTDVEGPTGYGNALKGKWHEQLKVGSYVWCNPPYSKPLNFVRKAIAEMEKGIGTVMLLNADFSTKATTLAAEHAQAAYITCSQTKDGVYYDGRMAFLNEFGVPQPINRCGQVFFVFAPFGGRVMGGCAIQTIPILTVQPTKPLKKQIIAKGDE